MRFDGVLGTIKEMRNEVGECMEWIVNAEIRFPATKDTVTILQAKVSWPKKNKHEIWRARS